MMSKIGNEYTGFKDINGEEIHVNDKLLYSSSKIKMNVFKDIDRSWLGTKYIYYAKIWTGEWRPLIHIYDNVEITLD